MNGLTIAREAIAHRGKRLEYFTIAWDGLEGYKMRVLDPLA
jgi:hypothetical protein